jgi:hypothetical protein
VGKEKFRRDLNTVFDEVAGPPSPTLGDRVHSSLIEAPKPRNYFWVAGVAAFLIAAVIVGVLFIANPLNRGVTPGGSTPSASPSPSVSPTARLVAFPGPCRLPITWSTGPSSNPSPNGGFLTFPGATFAADPNAHMEPTGEYWVTYNATTQKWLPVLRQFASPDGTKYLFFTLGNGTVMRITNATTGGQYDLDNEGKMWSPVGLDDTAAYAMGEARTGLWKLPLRVGPAVQLANGGWWGLISGGAAWGFASQSVPVGAPTVLRRLDLASGTSKDFATFTDPVQFVGVDLDGLPIMASSDGRSLFTLSASGDQTQIPISFSLPKGLDVGYSPYAVIGDRNGLWIAGPDGIYLYRNGSLGKVSTVVSWPDAGCV